MSERLRERAVNVAARKLLVSRLDGSDQEGDLAVPPNCNGYGRIRHFRMQTSPDWPSNPLPIIPACKALGMMPPAIMEGTGVSERRLRLALLVLFCAIQSLERRSKALSLAFC
jgi:hypothetical protein